MQRQAQPTAAQQRWNWRRVAGGVAELLRNFAVVAITAPLLEPLLTRESIRLDLALAGSFIGLAFIVLSVIFDHERAD